MRGLLRTVFVEAPLRFYDYANTGSIGARLLGLAVLVGALGTGAGVGAGVAFVLHRDVESGLTVGLIVGCLVTVLYAVLMFSLLLGVSLAAQANSEVGRRSGRHALGHGGATVTPFVVAAFFGILGSFIAVVTVVMALSEWPYRGPRAEAAGIVQGWTSGKDGRVFTVQYTVGTAPHTSPIPIADDPQLTLNSVPGDRTRLEYQLNDPSRVRGAGQADEEWSTVKLSAAVAAGCLAATAVSSAIALRRPSSPDRHDR
ncbi:MAG: hypothetical protein KJ792_06085 [Actinobacteria bacterium]|nr:hypothetical protein [Actinomycetota bacterium]MCG2801196.1 hypothetical protein [Cellulomonas sp.]